jgi:hypothetical protein
MSQRFERIKNPMNFARMMEIIGDLLPIHMDDEDIVATIYGLMSMYVHDSELAEYILTMATGNVKEFYDKINIKGESTNIYTVYKVQ